jgi:lipopolysaccharide/colanic/teichoic acid biosynthesis glycosyltransferase
VSVFALTIFSPLLIAIAVWVKLDSRGPVFYRGARAGRDNRPFRIFKFRSMVTDAEKVGGSSTSGSDSRVTRSGRFIRKYKIDEISQLFNVLAGDMSIVGPRPEVLAYTDKYEGELREIFSVRPGITDWSSIWNADEGSVLAGAPDPDYAFELLIQPTKLSLQLRYVRNHGFLIDLRIIFYTLHRLFNSDFYPNELADVPRLKPGSGASVPARPANTFSSSATK